MEHSVWKTLCQWYIVIDTHRVSWTWNELETNRAQDGGWGYYQGWRTKDDVRPAELGRAKGAHPMEQLAKRGGGTASTVSF